MENIKHILDSLLFVADAPLTVERLKAILIEAEAKEIRQALDELQAEYEQRQGGFDLRQVAGGYQFRSRNIYNEWITRLIEPSPVRLSKAALETLAIIAYKQPVIRSDVEHIRGVDCGGVLRVLLERHLIRVLGRKEIPGRPLIYATTKKFLEIFDLKDLRDLPSPKEIETFGQAIEGQVEVVEQDETEGAESIESEDDDRAASDDTGADDAAAAASDAASALDAKTAPGEEAVEPPNADSETSDDPEIPPEATDEANEDRPAPEQPADQ